MNQEKPPPPPSSAAAAPIAVALRLLTAASLLLALLSATLLLALRVVHQFNPGLLAWPLKSAIPLILVGVSFALLQFAAPSSRSGMILGLLASLAFILWGAEQYVSNQALVALMDDLVVFLFVFDLGIVIYGRLRPLFRLPVERPSRAEF
jgi:hypothetical protein